MDNGWLLFAEMEDCNNVLQHARRSGEVGGFFIFKKILKLLNVCQSYNNNLGNGTQHKCMERAHGSDNDHVETTLM